MSVESVIIPEEKSLIVVLDVCKEGFFALIEYVETHKGKHIVAKALTALLQSLDQIPIYHARIGKRVFGKSFAIEFINFKQTVPYLCEIALQTALCGIKFLEVGKVLRENFFLILVEEIKLVFNFFFFAQCNIEF